MQPQSTPLPAHPPHTRTPTAHPQTQHPHTLKLNTRAQDLLNAHTAWKAWSDKQRDLLSRSVLLGPNPERALAVRAPGACNPQLFALPPAPACILQPAFRHVTD